MRSKRLAPGVLAAVGTAAPAADPHEGSLVQERRRAPTTGRPIPDSPRKILGALFSFEALLVLYMFAVGIYKNDPRFAWLPVDATGLFFGLSVVVGSFVIMMNPIPKRAWPVILAMLAFVVYWAVTLAWSPSQVYGPDKVFSMATLELWGLAAAALIIAPDPERVRRLFTLLLLLAIWTGVEALLIHQGATEQGAPGFVNVGSGTYLNVGRVGGLGALVAFMAWLFGRRLSLSGVLFLAIFAGLAFVLMIGGGRGPLLATMVPILLALLLGLKITKRGILYKRYQLLILMAGALLVAGMSIYIHTTGSTPQSLKRLENMIVEGEVRGSAASRLDMYGDALDLWPEAPLLGSGAGSWPLLQGWGDRQHYPHNIFLEVLVEAGVVGLVLLFVLFGVGLRPISLDRLRNDPLLLCTFMMFVNAFINAMTTGDVAENRGLFMLLGLLLQDLRCPSGPGGETRWLRLHSSNSWRAGAAARPPCTL